MKVIIPLGLLLLTMAVLADAQSSRAVEIVSPVDGARMPDDVSTPCKSVGPCRKLFVEGRLSMSNYTPHLAVAPLVASPRIWIQPPVIQVSADGRFNAMVYLGTDREGVGEKFKIFLIAARPDKRFQEGQVLDGIPSDCSTSRTPMSDASCIVSEGVTVLRTR